MRLSKSGFVLVFVTFFVLPLLAGCGGGGGGSASAASQVTVSASTDNSGGSNGTTAGTTGGTTSPTPSSSPTGGQTTLGPATFSGQITDESGKGLSAVSLKAAPMLTTGKTADDQALSGSTDNGGNFRISGFNTDQAYALTIARQDRKTLRTVFTIDPKSPDVSLLLLAPQGTGLVEFHMPTLLKLRAVTSSVPTTPAWDPMFSIDPLAQTYKVNLDWDVSPNPGFLSYVVFSGDQPNMGLKADQLDVFFAPNNVKASHNVTVDKPKYYRVYEKMLIPELGTFLLAGTNEVLSGIPQAKLVSPADKATNVERSGTVEIDLPADVDVSKADVHVTTIAHPSIKQSRFTVAGTTTRTPGHVTFTPSTPLPGGRTVVVNVLNVVDANGDKNDYNSFSFAVKQGFVVDSAFAATNLGSVPAYTGQGVGTSTGDIQIDVDRNDDILYPDPNRVHKLERFDRNGAFVTSLPISERTVAADGNGDIFTVRQVNPQVITRYDAQGQSKSSFSTGLSSFPLPFVVDPVNQMLFGYEAGTIPPFIGDLYKFDYAGNLTTIGDNYPPTGRLGFCTDRHGNYYYMGLGATDPAGNGASRFQTLFKANSALVVTGSTLLLGGAVQDLTFVSGVKVCADTNGNVYTLESYSLPPPGGYTFFLSQFDSNLNLVNSASNVDPKIEAGGGSNGRMVADSQGRVYFMRADCTMIRMIANP